MAKSALAGLLAILLLLASMLSVSHALHQSLHQDGSSGNHLCVICSLVKGQVSAAETAVIFSLALLIAFFGIPLNGDSLQPAFKFSFSPGRAPPRR